MHLIVAKTGGSESAKHNGKESEWIKTIANKNENAETLLKKNGRPDWANCHIQTLNWWMYSNQKGPLCLKKKSQNCTSEMLNGQNNFWMIKMGGKNWIFQSLYHWKIQFSPHFEH